MSEENITPDYMRGFHAGRADVREQETDCGLRNHETFAASMILAGNVATARSGAAQRRKVRELVLAHFTFGQREPQALDETTALLAETLEVHVRRDLAGQFNAVAAELIAAACRRVDWRQLAEHELTLAREELDR